MNLQTAHFRFVAQRILRRAFLVAAAMALFAPSIPAATGSAKKFSSPEEAVRALAAAVDDHDTNALAAIFGPAYGDVASPEPAQAEEELTDFGKSLNTSNRLDRVAQDRFILETGPDEWPFPVPIVRTNNVWFFDTEAGKDELISRRIGRNELETLQSVRAYADAQREYASKDHDGDQVLEFAQKLVSSPGARDGLYWPPDADGELSPLGPFVAAAQSKGYLRNPGADNNPEPFHGYFFKILTRQGKNAPGGKYDYIINGNMVGGFGLVAWPAEYGESGIMTFIVNQQGKVYQKDLGPKTASIAQAMKEYDPNKSWTVSPD